MSICWIQIKTPPPMKNSTFPFVALCIAAPTVQLLEAYGLHHWEDGAVFSLALTGLVLSLALLGWSIWSIRHHGVRAVAGSIVCAYCLWQVFQNGKLIY